MPIAVVAELRAVSGAADRLVAVLAGLLDGVADLPGTSVFAIHRTQDDEDLVMVYELHADDAAFERADAAAAEALGSTLDALLAAPPTVRRFELDTSYGLPGRPADQPGRRA